MKSDEARCLASGMDGYLAKPVTSDALAHALARFAPVGDARAPGPLVDRAVGLRGVDGDADLLAEVTGLFVEDWPARQEELRAALSAGERARLERAAHGIKGVLAALGATRAAASAAGLESVARERRLDDAPAQLAALEHEVALAVSFFAVPAVDR